MNRDFWTVSCLTEAPGPRFPGPLGPAVRTGEEWSHGRLPLKRQGLSVPRRSWPVNPVNHGMLAPCWRLVMVACVSAAPRDPACLMTCSNVFD